MFVQDDDSGFGVFGNSQVTVSGHGYNFFTVRFTNEQTIAAKQMVFAIDFAKASRIIVTDDGTFARCSVPDAFSRRTLAS